MNKSFTAVVCIKKKRKRNISSAKNGHDQKILLEHKCKNACLIIKNITHFDAFFGL